jgi:membrane protease YdiL (CAAX protease family)
VIDFPAFLFALDGIFKSEWFVIGYYAFTVGTSLLLIKETKNRIRDLAKGSRSIIYAPVPFGMLLAYLVLVYPHAEKIPVLNWSWLGYNIAFGPFAEQGFWGVVPFIPLLVYMFIHINFVEEFYFRKSKIMVLLWAAAHIAMGVKIHMAIMLIPVGFLFKYIYDKKGINHSYAMHFATNILVVITLFLTLLR